MADYVIDKKEHFEYTYSSKQQEEIEQIRNKYLPKQESKMEQLIRLDKSAEKPGQMASIAIGVIGVLTLGAGMSCTMLHAENPWIFGMGIVVGLIGILASAVAYPLYEKITRQQRAKIADQIIALTNELSL